MSQANIIDDLRRAGIKVDSVDALRVDDPKFEPAAAVLLKWLPRLSVGEERMSVIWALGQPWAYEAAFVPLVELFQQLPRDQGLGPDHRERWYVGDGIARLAKTSDCGVLKELAALSRLGEDRGLIIERIPRVCGDSPETSSFVAELLDDPSVDYYAIRALGSLRAVEYAPKLKRMLGDPRAADIAIRHALKQALAKIES
jgi:hypothetical protein